MALIMRGCGASTASRTRNRAPNHRGSNDRVASIMNGSVCENRLLGHEYAIRKVRWSPHRPDILASGSYDMTCRM
ncbi:hypothetical protein BC826DRAFT_1076890 [Russula brevipes]|nr:hypothetical protein BC826DRAFT_1076890 [Russula brevipes]